MFVYLLPMSTNHSFDTACLATVDSVVSTRLLVLPCCLVVFWPTRREAGRFFCANDRAVMIDILS